MDFDLFYLIVKNRISSYRKTNRNQISRYIDNSVLKSNPSICSLLCHKEKPLHFQQIIFYLFFIILVRLDNLYLFFFRDLLLHIDRIPCLLLCLLVYTSNILEDDNRRIRDIHRDIYIKKKKWLWFE